MNRLISLDKHLTSNTLQADFDNYRSLSTIDKQQFNKIVYGGNYKQRLLAFQIIKNNPKNFHHYHLSQVDRSQQRKDVNQVLFKLKQSINLSDYAINDPNKLTMFANGLTFYDLNIITKLGVHYSLYMKTIQKLGTQKHKQFYQNACKFKDLGCFALTQIFHGSNVKSALTQAHYDHQSKQFIINSPSKEAMKFWIGGAGKSSNMSIVWAQLYIKDKCYGLHAFVVPLRCPRTHNVLPGIIIGDCGPKFGLNAVDNGFILFDKFRIPADNLLNKVSGINEKGQFFSTIQGQSKRFGLTISALSEGRLFTCCHGSTMGMSALTIALRYTFVRKQFTKKHQAQKQQVLLINYPLTRRRMIPLLAQQIIYMCTTMNTFQQTQSLQEKNLLSNTNPLLQELHAISSVLKAKTTWFSTQAIRESRQMMGGHGYSAYSKMGTIYSNNDVNNTWQGDNYVLTQQTTKYVLQNFGKAMKGKPIKSSLLQFLSSPLVQQKFQISRQFLLNLNKIQKYLQSKIYNKTQQMAFKMMQLKQQKINSTQIWNGTQIYLGQTIALSTGDLYILKMSVKKLNQIKDQKTKSVFKDIIHLWTLLILKNDELFSQDHQDQIQKLIIQYSNKLVPQILGLLEAVSANQSVLGTPFADQNGKGFEKYMNFVLRQVNQNKQKRA